VTPVAVAVHGRGLVPPGEPVFSAADESILRGAAAFETVRVYGGCPFLLDRHLARLAHSAAVLGLPPVSGAAELALLVAGAAPADHVLRIFRTEEVLVATAAALPPGLDELRRRGLSLRTFDRHPSALLVGVKSTSYAEAVAARRAAEAAGADDALFVSGERVLDTATANIWWSTGGRLHTPPSGPGVLDGVTRGLVLELMDIPGGPPWISMSKGSEKVVEGHGAVGSLLAADEAFTTSSIREVMPVVRVDGRPVGDGSPGPVAARLQAALRLRSLA
jgi:branched-subunit amino acid aminotransferase/4-amino-4-deoxychorismate lyase